MGMIYRKFYHFCGTSTLLRLYKAFVKPHLFLCVGSATGQRPRGTGISLKVCPEELLSPIT